MIQNQSRLGELEKCPRRYAYRYLPEPFGLAPKQPSARLESGLWVHAGLAGWYRSLDREVALRAYDEAYAISPVDKGDPDVQRLHDVWFDRLVEYVDHYTERRAWRVLMVPEQELVLTIGRHKLFTRLDLIVQNPDNNTIWVMDHKSADKTGPSYYPKFYVDKQGSSYVLAAEEALNTEISGWIINVLKSTKDKWFERQAFTRQADQLASFRRQTENQLDKLEEAVVAYPGTDNPKELDAYLDKHFPQYTHECHNFGTCAFLAICQAGLRAAAGSFKKRDKDYVDGVGVGGGDGGSA